MLLDFEKKTLHSHADASSGFSLKDRSRHHPCDKPASAIRFYLSWQVAPGVLLGCEFLVVGSLHLSD
jgi:hypothetical protein